MGAAEEEKEGHVAALSVGVGDNILVVGVQISAEGKSQRREARAWSLQF